MTRKDSVFMIGKDFGFVMCEGAWFMLPNYTAYLVCARVCACAAAYA